MARGFPDVQVFFEFLTDLDNPQKRKTIDQQVVHLLDNLDPSGKTNTALELAKIYSWYLQTYTYTPSSQENPEGTITIKPQVLPLSQAINSTSTTEAATPSAVKQAYDLAASKSIVSFSPTLLSGTKLGTITINNTSTDLYCETPQSITVDSSVSKSSTNPVENQAITNYVDDLDASFTVLDGDAIDAIWNNM